MFFRGQAEEAHSSMQRLLMCLYGLVMLGASVRALLDRWTECANKALFVSRRKTVVQIESPTSFQIVLTAVVLKGLASHIANRALRHPSECTCPQAIFPEAKEGLTGKIMDIAHSSCVPAAASDFVHTVRRSDYERYESYGWHEDNLVLVSKKEDWKSNRYVALRICFTNERWHLQ